MTMAKDGLVIGRDGKSRCFWCGDDEFYQKYHDHEWGHPVRDDVRLFEKICLEGFQSGLSWITILRKRENFRAAFDGFNFNKIAKYSQKDVERLVQDVGIIRHRGKIESTINNAQRAIELQKEYGTLAEYFWSWKPDPKSRPKVMTYQALITNPKTDQSLALSKDLKKRGWSFVGPTTCYAFMQAMGLVNDHLDGCHMQGKMKS